MNDVRVSLFATCLCDMFAPEVAESTVRVLRRLGVEVRFPEGQTCCGQPGYNSGYGNEAREVARQLIRAFEEGGNRDVIVAPSGSCAAMVRHDYPKLFAEEPEWAVRAAALGERVYELTEFIVHVLKRREIGGRLAALATYHPSCHMTRGLGLREEPIGLLRGIADLELVDLPHASDCCGFGGTFAIKMSSISTAIVDAKVDAVEASGAHLLVGGDTGCLMQIGGRLSRMGKPVRVMHIAQLLDEAGAGIG